MINEISEVLMNSDQWIDHIDHIEDGAVEILHACWHPCIRCHYSASIGVAEAFLLLLSQWVKGQKRNFAQIKPESKDKSSRNLLFKLFGTLSLSSLKVEEAADAGFFLELEEHLIWSNEKDRKKELRYLKEAKGVKIACKTGAILYFGVTRTFCFLISSEYIKSMTLTVYRDILELVESHGGHESIRKRPGMYIGSNGMRGVCRLLSGLIEDLLGDAAEKIISLMLLPHHTVQITCESYSVANNTRYFNHLPIASALSTFFEYQDEQGRIRTEKGVNVLSDAENAVSKGVRIVFELDDSILDHIEFDYYVILNRMTELAILNPYTIYLSNQENHNKIAVPSGLHYLLEKDLYGFSGRILPMEVAGDQFTAKIAISFLPLRSKTRKSYVNSQATEDGGTHVAGLMNGASKALKKILAHYQNDLTPQDLLKHLNYAIHVRIDHPRYYGATKRKLINLEVKLPIQRQVEQELYRLLMENIMPLKYIYFSLF